MRRTSVPRTLADEVIGQGERIVGRGREIWLAGLGALEDGADAFTTLVERGREVESRGRERLARLRDGVADREHSLAEGADHAVHAAVDRALSVFGVPTRDEIHALGRRVDALSGRIDALGERLAASERAGRSRESRRDARVG